MKLLFGLLFLALANVIIFRTTDPATAGYVALAILSVQLAALWTFRTLLPQAVQDSVLIAPPRQILVRWTALACSATLLAIVAAASYSISNQVVSDSDAVDRHWAGWIAIALCGPLLEEIVFRAWLIESLSTEFTRPIAMVGAALLFGLLHFDQVDVIAFPLTFFFGLVWGISYLRSRSILPGLAAHVFGNTVYLVSVNWG